MALALCAAGTAGHANGRSSEAVVAVVEPHSPSPGSDQLAYSLSLGESKLLSVGNILDGLSKTNGIRLVVLVHEAVPIGVVPSVVSMASKAGYAEYTVFIFDRDRKGMMAIPTLKWVTFSTDPRVLDRLLH
jgi:hypothetical protein